MDDIVPVHVVQALNDFTHDDGGGFLREGLALLEEEIELSVAGQLQQKIDIVFIAEAVVELDEVRMAEKRLHFYLADHLLHRLLVLLLRPAE